jgi:ABC-type transporter Mla MlaB component
VVAECWRDARARNGAAIVRVDLRGVTSMDPAGRECLADFRRRGAEFRADGLTEAVVAEITES